jgi:phosphofructokinase-like protein
MKIGILTGGGDCPGLNAAIRAVVRRSADKYGSEVFGIKNGWKGLIEGWIEPLGPYTVSGILPRGGTILGTSRTNPFKDSASPLKIRDNIKKWGLDFIVAIGGEDTLSVAKKMHDQGIPTLGIPKTIDNDIAGTEYTFGFDTAVAIATEAIDRLHTTAESHHRVMVVEVMGRHTGWIAVYAGMAGGADAILIPEVECDIDELVSALQARHKRGKTFSIVVAAEGARCRQFKDLVTQDDSVDEFGHVRLGGVGVKKRSGIDTRVTVLGHVQRGGTPSAGDRVLATRFGVAAADAAHEGKSGEMVALQRGDIVTVPLEVALSESKPVDPKLYEVAKVFFG